ncbi:response regulator [Candidatus Parcubacteria bacterium]|nr:response regulator [Candidatus Parcubacteria bacterium]
MSNKKTILIAEDEAAMLRALSKKFSGEGFNVLEAKDGEETLANALDKKPDLVMLDIIMPKMDGIDVMKKIREDRKWGSEVPIIMLTNLSDAGSVSEAAKFGVYDFLVKTDWRLDDVVDLVKAKLNL